MQNRCGDKHLSHLARISCKQQSWGKRALGVLAAVCLNLAMQPCAMASQADDEHDCPHCPPAQTHDGHGDRHGGMEHEMPCADGAADCTVDKEWSHDGRGAQFKLKDAPTDLPIAIAPHETGSRFRHPGDAILPPRYASVHTGKPPPLHVLYCVYLD